MTAKRLNVGHISRLLASANLVADMLGVDRLGGDQTCDELKAKLQSIAGAEPKPEVGYANTRLSQLLIALSHLRVDARVLEAAEIQAWGE